MPHKLIEWKLNKFCVRLENNAKSSEFKVKVDWMTCSQNIWIDSSVFVFVRVRSVFESNRILIVEKVYLSWMAWFSLLFSHCVFFISSNLLLYKFYWPPFYRSQLHIKFRIICVYWIIYEPPNVGLCVWWRENGMKDPFVYLNH